MRRGAGLLLAVLALAGAGCGSGDSASGESVGDDAMAGEGTRDAGSVGEQVSAEDVSELEKLREQVALQCDGSRAPRLRSSVDTTLRVTAQNSERGIVDLSQVDRAENIRDYVDSMAELLENCGAQAEAQRLRSAEYGTALG